MRIVFGWNYINLKSYPLSSLVTTDNETLKNTDLVVREAYFHLFWIPFFSLGRRYHLKNQGKYFKPSADILVLINKDQLKPRKKWYAWILTLLIGLGMVFLGVVTTLYYSTESSFTSNAIDRKNELINHPQVGNRFTLQMNATFLNCEVNKVTANEIWITIDYSNYEEYKLYSKVIKKSTDDYIAYKDSMADVKSKQENLAKHSVFIDSLKSVYPDQQLLTGLVALSLENVPKSYSVIRMTRKEFETLKSAMEGKPSVNMPSLHSITKSKIGFGSIEN